MVEEKKINYYSLLRLVFLVFCVIVLGFIVSSPILAKVAFGDGLFMEELSASFGDRKADLIIKMTPPVVTTETLEKQNQKPIFTLPKSENRNEEGFKHVTYFITIEKDGKKLISDWFHDHKGDLKIEMKPSNDERITIYGEPDPILQAFTGTEDSPVIATGPIFSEGGLYHFIVRVATIDYDRSFIPDDKQPVYDGWLSVGSTENQQISLSDGEQVEIQIISYYDDLKDFRFDPTRKQIEFTMPFDWNITRLEENNLMVHQEITIPKQSDLASVSYIGKVNGIDVTKNLMLDDSNSTKNVIHFMLPKPVVMQIAEQVNNNGQDSNKLMQFSLEPSESIAPSTMASSHA